MIRVRRLKLALVGVVVLFVAVCALVRVWATHAVAPAEAITQLKENIRHNMELGRRENTESDARRLLEMAKKEGDRASEAFAYRYLGFAVGSKTPELGMSMQQKALEANESISNFEGMVGDCNLLYGYYRDKDPVTSEQMLNKLLNVQERRYFYGQATIYEDLARISENQGNKAEARDRLVKARDLFATAGLQNRVRTVQASLDRLDGVRESIPDGNIPFAPPSTNVQP